MTHKKLHKSITWLITIKLEQDSSEIEKDFIVELVSEEARKTTEDYTFIVEDVMQNNKFSKILIDGTENALANLVAVIKDNLPCRVDCMRIR